MPSSPLHTTFIFSGGSGGGKNEAFVNTGYGTYAGQGNVPTGAEKEKGTGYDEHGQVKTKFGTWQVGYDPVSGTTAVTAESEPGLLDAMGAEAAGLVVPPALMPRIVEQEHQQQQEQEDKD